MKESKKTIIVMLILATLGAAGVACKGKPEKKAGYYTCSMHPQVIQHEPGNCPICGMRLSYVEHAHEEKKTKDDEHAGHSMKGEADKKPAEEGEKKKANFQFSLAASVLANSNLVTVPVQKEEFAHAAKYPAHIDYNEDPDRLVIISTKYDGWVERLYVSKEGQYVGRGKTLMGIYSPQILAAKEEFVTTYNTLKSLYLAQGKPAEELKADPTYVAARRKLSYLDVPAGQINKLEESGKASRLTYYSSPISGVIVKKNVLQGSFVKPGVEIMRIANLARLWVFIHIFEKDLPFVKKGQKVSLKTTAYPEDTFKGRVDLIYPFVDPNTRDIKVRIVLTNSRGKIKPGMFAEVQVESKLRRKQLTIPDSAIIYSGDKSYVFVSLGQGKFETRHVVPRMTSAGRAAIADGLEENELVVINGQFLLDSEASLKEAMSKGQGGQHAH